MYGDVTGVLRAIGNRDSVRVRGIPVHRVIFAAVGFPGRVFHNKRLSLSSIGVREGNVLFFFFGFLLRCVRVLG